MSTDTLRTSRLAMIALILQSSREVEGRTKLQKMAYLTNLLWNSISDFKFHLYGPFSETLAKEVDEMRDAGWIEERPIATRSDNVQYNYRISPKKSSTANALIARIENPDLVRKTSGLLKQLSAFSSDELEIMSSLVYLKKSNPNLNKEQLVHLTRELKPRFGTDQITRGLRIFEIFHAFGRNYFEKG